MPDVHDSSAFPACFRAETHDKCVVAPIVWAPPARGVGGSISEYTTWRRPIAKTALYSGAICLSF